MADEFDAGAAVSLYLSGTAPTPETTLRTTLQDVVVQNPDQAADWRRTAATIGVPVDTAQALPEWSKQQKALAAIDTGALARMNPVTTAFLSQAEQAAIAHDDTASMGLIETLANSFRRGVPGLKQVGSATALRANVGALEQFDRVATLIDGGAEPGSILANDDPMGVAWMTPEQRATFRESIVTPLGGNVASIVKTQKERQAIRAPGVVDEVMKAETFKQAFSAFMTDPVLFIASIGPESMVTNAPGLLAAIPAGIAAGPGGAAAAMGSGSFATDYASSIVEALSKSGVNVADVQSLYAAVRDEKLMRGVAAQAFAHASVVGTMDAASGGIAAKLALPGRVAEKLAGKPIARELANVAAQVPIQGMLGAAGEAGGQVAAGQKLDPGNILAEFVGEAFTAPAEIASVAGRTVMARMGDARAAEQTATRIEQLQQAVDQSKLRARDPDTFKAFIDQVAQQGDAPSELYINAETLANTLNQSGITMAELQALAPSVAEQMRAETFVPGADLRIPVSELLAAPSEITTTLVDHLRESPDAMSRAEAAEFVSSQGEQIRAEVERELSRQDAPVVRQQQVAEVQAVFEGQLNDAGKFRPEVNKAYASMLGNFYVTQAERAGMTPQEMMEKYQLGVSSKDAGGRQRLDQTPSAVRDSAGKEYPSLGEPLPTTGVAPANLGSSGTVFVGRRNGQHFEIAEKFPAREHGPVVDTGFVNPQGDYLTRDEALAWVEQNEQAVRTSEGMEGQLDAMDYREQVPDSKRSAGLVLNQGARGALNFGTDITASPSVIALLDGADLSTFLHESAHFFLEVQTDLAARIVGRIHDGDTVTDGERQIVADMDAVLASFGISGTPDQSALLTWLQMSLEERRESHETFARSFEQYAMEGKAPNQELQAVFQRFRSWLVSIYKTLAGLNVNLTDDVRAVFDRMLASDSAIQQAQDARNMGPFFQTPEQAGMTPEEYADYQALGRRATDTADAELDTRLLKDMKWMSRAKDRAIKARQKEVAELRNDVRAEVSREVLSQPVYRAWQFLTGRGHPLDRLDGTPKIGRAKTLDVAKDNLFEAIAKLGGLNKTMVEGQWGKQDKLASGVFGAPVLRREGLSIDAMAEALIETGYLLPDENGGADLTRFEELFGDQARGIDRFSISRDLSGPDDAPVNPIADPELFHGKLNTDDLKARFGEEADAVWRLLSERRMTSANGLAVDLVAETFGYESGTDLVQALAAAQSPKEAIDAITDQRMLERHGDITSKQALERAAEEAIHNEVRARVIATELKALAKATSVRESSDSLYVGGTVDVMARAARDYAAQVVARQRLKDLRPKQYAAAEARSAKLAQSSLGNLQEAAMHKRNQLVNNFATKAAYEAQAEVTAANEFFKKVLKGTAESVSKTRDFGTVQAARAILAEYGIGSKGEPAQKYLSTMSNDDPAMFQVLSEKVAALTASAKPAGDMTVEEFRGLVEEIQSLWHMARRSRQIEVDGQLVDRYMVEGDLVARMVEIGIPDRVAGEGQAVTDAERRLTKLQTLRSALRRVEFWVGAKDGLNAMGPFRKYVWQPVREAADRYRADKATYIRKYRALLETVDIGKARIAAPELGYTFGFSRGGSGKAEILHAILHTGNESNKRKLLLGRGWATENDITGELDLRRWDAFVNRMITEGVLTKADFAFAQGVWDLLEGTKALAQKAHRDVFGHYFAEVTADGFTNQFGSYRGGYVPAMMDPEVVKDAATRSLQEDENQTLAYAFPSTSKGFTKSRVEHNKPLLLDLRSLSSHIDKVLLFSHMEQPVRDVRKVLGSREVSEPLHRIDPTAFDGLLTPWLNRAARQTVEAKVPGDNNMMRVFSKMRQRAGMALMFANVSNTVQQITGFSLAAVKVGPGHLMQGLATYVMAPRQTTQTVSEASIYMASRMDNEVAQMTDAIDQILMNPNLYEKAQAWNAKHAYFMQAAVDNVMGPIIWTAAYNQALQRGQEPKDAVRLADSAVRETQGSTLPEDVSRAETGNAFVRMFTQFAGYFNMQANLLGTEFSHVMHEMGLRKGMGRGLYVFVLGFLVPGMVAEIIAQAFRGGIEDEDEDGSTIDDWLMSVLLMGNLKTGLAMIPGVGQIANAGINAFDKKPYNDRITTSPAISMLESAVGVPSQIYRAASGEEVSARKAVRDVATLISMTTGLPAYAIARPVGYMTGVAEERIAPTGPLDNVRGLVTGTPSPESKQ